MKLFITQKVNFQIANYCQFVKHAFISKNLISKHFLNL